jgi:hypothetical protein
MLGFQIIAQRFHIPETRRPRWRLLSPVKERGRNSFQIDSPSCGAGDKRGDSWTSNMPSLFRFLVFIGLLGGLAYAAVFSLANFVPYKQREISVSIPQDKFLKPQR